MNIAEREHSPFVYDWPLCLLSRFTSSLATPPFYTKHKHCSWTCAQVAATFAGNALKGFAFSKPAPKKKTKQKLVKLEKCAQTCVSQCTAVCVRHATCLPLKFFTQSLIVSLEMLCLNCLRIISLTYKLFALSTFICHNSKQTYRNAVLFYI